METRTSSRSEYEAHEAYSTQYPSNDPLSDWVFGVLATPILRTNDVVASQ